jgi:uncharacterized sporulation protein YeaH/YhbH (DUF444 family)
VLTIDRDLQRFRDVVRGRVRRDLRRWMGQSELFGRKGDDVVSIPIPQIELPRLRYGENQKGGVGQGQGEPGDGAGEPSDGAGAAGGATAEHLLEVDLSIDELATILGEELELPRIEPRGGAGVDAVKARYTSIARRGPESLRHGRRTFKEALKRQIATGSYDPARPSVVPVRDDRRYRAPVLVPQPLARAAALYLMDVSGSMGTEQKAIVRNEVFWIDAWLRKHYQGFEARFVIHDAEAREVDRDTFFRTREAGGTVISTAYALAADLIEADYPAEAWNVYAFHFSDGDNLGHKDNEVAVGLLRARLLPRLNQFGYVQTESAYGSGRFFQVLAEAFADDDEVVLSRVPNRDAVLDSIRALLGKGR